MPGIAEAFGALIKLTPRWVWELFAALAILAGIALWHNGAVHRHDTKIIAAEDARLAAKANAIADRAAQVNRQISDLERKINEANTIRTNALADSLRAQGPGKAACPASGASGRSQSSGGTLQFNLAPVPNDEGEPLIGLPYNDTVYIASVSDLNRDEVLRWRSWYRKLAAAWPKMQ